MRLFTRVNPHVNVQVGGASEGLATDLTFVWLFAGVSSHMGSDVASVQQLVAQRTLLVQLLCLDMGLHVLLERAAERERFATQIARIDASLLLGLPAFLILLSLMCILDHVLERNRGPVWEWVG